MNIPHNQHKHLLVSNRVAFMIIGVLEAAWAPLVPYVKSSFAISEYPNDYSEEPESERPCSSRS